MAKYVAPPWACPAPADGQHYELEVVKEGVVLERDRVVLVAQSHRVTNASQGYFLLGRQDDVVDFVLAHASISRVHAVLQYRQDGALLLLDLGSAQGTFINKKACSREGVYERLYVGDMIKFGASTRQYVVQGPSQQSLEEYDSENLRAYRARLADTAARAQDRLEISWGMHDEHEYRGGDDENVTTGKAGGELLLPDDLPDYLRNDEHYAQKLVGRGGGNGGGGGGVVINEADFAASEKDRAVLEKVRVKQRKLEHMQTELRQIQVKEAAQENGLTEGQQKTVARNEQAIEKLTTEIQELVRSVQDKRQQRQGPSVQRSDARGKNLPELDDVLDETSATAAECSATNWRGKKAAKGAVGRAGGEAVTTWTHESLLQEVAAQQPLLESVRAQMQQVRDVLADNKEDSSQHDESDEIVRQAVCKEAHAKLLRLEDDEAKLVAKLATLERLVAIAAPALPSLASRSLAPPATATGAATNAATVNVPSAVVPAVVTAVIPAAVTTEPVIPTATAIPDAALCADTPASVVPATTDVSLVPSVPIPKRKNDVSEAPPAPGTKPKRPKKEEEKLVYDTYDEWKPPPSSKDANAAAAQRAAKLGY